MNLQRAFDAYEEAMLTVREIGPPQLRAMIHNNFGSAWMDMNVIVPGERCVRKAIGHLRAAVAGYTVRAWTAIPEGWSRRISDSHTALWGMVTKA